MQKMRKVLLSLILALTIVWSVIPGIVATETEHEHEWTVTGQSQDGHGLECLTCGESKEAEHTFDGADSCVVCGFRANDVTEPETTEPETTEPEVTEPEVTEPEVTEPEVTEPEVTEPEVTEPEVTEPVVTQPTVTEPTVTQPAATEPTATEPEVTEPEETQPEETTQPEEEPVPTETVPQPGVEAKPQNGALVWIWAGVVAAGVLGVALLIWMRKLT